jgi:mono/diheme cytochrome c family protein
MASGKQARSTGQWRPAGIAAWAVIGGLLVACKPPGETRRIPEGNAEARGLALIESAGCGACHEIPGVDWPKGRLGPSLAGFDDVGLIAGALPNRPGTLAAFIRDAPAVKPGSTMPPMPLSESQAADIAAYLYGIDHD